MTSKEDQPDMFMVSADSSFFSNVSLMGYYYNMEIFGTKEEGRLWIKEFVSVEDKAVRLRMIQDLHFKFLLDGRVFPAFFTSYIAVASTPMNINFSKYFASNPFYLLTAKSDE